jgi:hypothetical protein
VQEAYVVGGRLEGRPDLSEGLEGVQLGGAQPVVDTDGQRGVVELDGPAEAVRVGGGEAGLRGVRFGQRTRHAQALRDLDPAVERCRRLVGPTGCGEGRTEARQSPAGQPGGSTPVGRARRR